MLFLCNFNKYLSHMEQTYLRNLEPAFNTLLSLAIYCRLVQKLCHFRIIIKLH